MISRIATTLRARGASPLFMRFASGTFWHGAGAAIAGVIGMLTTFLLIQQLGKDTFGKYVALQSTTMLLSAIVGYGLGMAATRFAGELRLTDPEKFGYVLAFVTKTAFAIGVGLAVLTALGADQIANHAFGDSELGRLLWPMSLAIIFLTLDALEKSILIGLETPKRVAIASVVGIALGSVTLLTATAMYGLEGAAFGLIASTAIQLLVSHSQVRAELARLGLRRTGSGKSFHWAGITEFAVPGAIASLIIIAAQWSAQIILLRANSGFGELATLNIAMQWFNIILFFPTSAGKAVLPLFVEQNTLADRQGTRSILRYGVAANALVAAPAGLVLALAAPLVMSIYGAEFESDSVCLIIIAAAALFGAVLAPIGMMLAAHGKMWLCALLNSGWGLVYIAAAWMLAPHGAIGVCAGFLIAYVFHSISLSCFLWNTRSLRESTPK